MQKHFYLSIFLSIACLISQAQDTRLVSGQVVDGVSGEPLVGTLIQLQGTTTGTSADIDGRYFLKVPASSEKQYLIFSFVGFEKEVIEIGAQTTVDVTMKEDLQSLEEVVITAQQRGQARAINQQINSNTLVNVVAGDRLQENPDANAVEALGRLPGVSVHRNGGEGTGLSVRGLSSNYVNVTMNGVSLPANERDGRGTGISGISQFALDGAEIYKAVTPDLESNAVGGTINLKLREAPEDFRSAIMFQKGYNRLNDDWGNYKLLAEASNRFFDNRLGIFASVIAERVNRSAETQDSGLGTISETDAEQEPIYANSTSLRITKRIKERKSATISMDYRLNQSTKLKLYSMYSRESGLEQQQNKNFNFGAATVSYGMNDKPNNVGDIFSTTASGETKTDFLNMSIDYGLSYNFSKTNNPYQYEWGWNFRDGFSSDITVLENRLQDPINLIPQFPNRKDSLNTLFLSSIHQESVEREDKNLTAYIDLKIPVKIGGASEPSFIKFGGRYRHKTRYQDRQRGGANFGGNQFATELMADSLSWIVSAEPSRVTAQGLVDEEGISVVDGQYYYGYTLQMDRLREMAQWWDETSEYYYSQGPEVWQPIFGEQNKIGYSTDIEQSLMSDQDISEDYMGAYIMSELNLTDKIMVLPGVRYEHVQADMKGYYSIKPTLTGPMYEKLPGYDTEASRKNDFLLPMMHIRYKPFKSFYTHLSYTQTLSRPQFNHISPNTFVGTGNSFRYIATNPNIKPELWQSFDAQFTLHNDNIGLLSATGFYKIVSDKIWERSYRRLSTDPVIDPFSQETVVPVTLWENHNYDVYIRGMEVEWQTNFHYLPGFLGNLTLYANYTYTHSETQNPLTRIDQVVPPEGGRPVPVRIDSTYAGPMLNQPRHVSNLSLGYADNAFNVWLSFQYNGENIIGYDRNAEYLNTIKGYFYRYDLQMSYAVPVKKSKLEFLINAANLSDFVEQTKLKGDPRPTSLEQYGWTVDFAVRYRI